MIRNYLQAVLFSCCTAFAGLALAEDEPGCFDCHTADSDSPVHAVFNSVHGNLNGGGAHACTSCHGPSEAHNRRGRRNPPDISFGPKWMSETSVQNDSCLGCHEQTGGKLLWLGSEHEQENMDDYKIRIKNFLQIS